MKKINILIAAGFLAVVSTYSCKKLDLNPLDVPSTSTFYANQDQLQLAVNDLYRQVFWTPTKENTGAWEEFFSDNAYYRGGAGSNPIIAGTLSSSDGNTATYWLNCYKAVARVNAFLENKDKAVANTSAAIITGYEAEMRLIRAYQYAGLISHFGDVPFITKTLTIPEASNVVRANKTDIYKFILSEYDFAAANLPQTYGSAVKRLTKGAALALKARAALYMGDWATAKNAAAATMALTGAGSYTLNSSYATLFQRASELSTEIIFSIPRDQVQKVSANPADILSRNAGGYGATMPTRELVDAFECTDGKPIDESGLYNPLNPFANRDPRLAATVVPFNTYWLGYNYSPHPDSTKVFSSKLGKLVSNKDSRSVAAFASFTGFLFKKGVEQNWADNQAEDNDAIIIRYAEVLLTYAEAKIELNEIDASVLNAINLVRARAYGVPVAQVASYPTITTMGQIELRKIVRRERRVEFAFEGLRYMDLIRWRLAEKALNNPIIAFPDPAKQNRAKWPFPGVTPIDADGIADYSGFGSDVKIQFVRKFDATKQYLWPIPQQEVRLNPKIIQNPNY